MVAGVVFLIGILFIWIGVSGRGNSIWAAVTGMSNSTPPASN